MVKLTHGDTAKPLWTKFLFFNFFFFFFCILVESLVQTVRKDRGFKTF